MVILGEGGREAYEHGVFQYGTPSKTQLVLFIYTDHVII